MLKKEMRNYFRTKAKALSSDYIQTASEKISGFVTELPEFISANSVFIYVSTNCEPETRGIIEKAWSMNKTVCVPKCISEGEMIPVAIGSLSELCVGAMGISEPVNCCDAVSRDKIDIAVIPCVAADRNGNRLGHGGGYYDRFLDGACMKKVCLCFEENISEQIPTDKNDVSMELVVSENGIYKKAAR